MKKNRNSEGAVVVMEAEVARRIRQHGRSSMKAEVCGVLIGREQGTSTFVDACIAGDNAAQGGAHVTFTQDTWEHIYAVKDEHYPDERIVGWYHSHPGFGVFLSDHDEFIHQNFFSSPRQVAWVYDPHSDEEGCFGWDDKRITKIDDVKLNFKLPVGEGKTPDLEGDHDSVKLSRPRDDGDERGWLDWAFTAGTYLAIFALGVVLALSLVRPRYRYFVLTPGGVLEIPADRISQDASDGISIEGPQAKTDAPEQKTNGVSHPGGQNAGK